MPTQNCIARSGMGDTAAFDVLGTEVLLLDPALFRQWLHGNDGAASGCPVVAPRAASRACGAASASASLLLQEMRDAEAW